MRQRCLLNFVLSVLETAATHMDLRHLSRWTHAVCAEPALARRQRMLCAG